MENHCSAALLCMLLLECLRLAGHFPGVVIGVQQVVGALAQGLFQVLPVQGLHIGVLVGEADGRVGVQLPENDCRGSSASSAPSWMGWPPPPAQPPGQAMTSTKS